MSYFIVSFIPKSEPIYNFVQEYRKKYDPLFYKIIEPHFTFSFFKKQNINIDNLIKQIKNSFINFKAFTYNINNKILYKDNISKSYSTLLIPENISPFYDIYYKIYQKDYKEFIKNETFIPGIPLTSDQDFEKAYMNFEHIKTQKFILTLNNISIISFSELKMNLIENITFSSI